MKVWLVIGGWDYEGYAMPEGVFSTEELAKEALARVRGYDDKEIVEYEIDKPREN